MTAFDRAWDVAKEFRFNKRGYDIFQGGGYDPETNEAFVNLSSHTQGFKMDHPDNTDYYHLPQVFRSDKELRDRVLRVLGHEMTHQALSPPHSNDLWDAVSMRGLPDDISDEERAKHQAKVDWDWNRFQEYGAWSATPGVDEDEKWRMLELYGIERGDGE